jgi:hypothetical protein
MFGRKWMRSRLILTIMCVMCWITVPAAGATPDDERLQELEREVAELRVAIEELRAAGLAEQRLAEIERRLEILAEEVENLKVGEASVTVSRDGEYSGLGPAASKVYAKEQGVSVGGYGEALLEIFDDEREDGSASDKTDRFDFLRAVFYFGYNFSDSWVFNSEIEYVHASTSEGGFAKGIALREAAAAALAADASCVMMNFGGHIEVAGDCGKRWVEIADPRQRSKVVARISLDSGSVATSGNSERGLVVEGVEFGHILDPLSGRPARNWGAVTVVAADPVAADCLATALFVMGPDRGADWVRAQAGIEAVFAKGSGITTQLTATAGLRGRLMTSEGTVTYMD